MTGQQPRRPRDTEEAAAFVGEIEGSWGGIRLIAKALEVPLGR